MTGAILLAGGKGSRLGGDIPKQYIKVAGKMIIEYSLDVLIKSKEVDTLVIVAKDIWHEEIRAIIDRYPNRSKFVGFSLPGKTRQRSIYNALKYMREFADDEDSVLIHDAARPNLTEGLLRIWVMLSRDMMV